MWIRLPVVSWIKYTVLIGDYSVISKLIHLTIIFGRSKAVWLNKEVPEVTEAVPPLPLGNKMPSSLGWLTLLNPLLPLSRLKDRSINQSINQSFGQWRVHNWPRSPLIRVFLPVDIFYADASALVARIENRQHIVFRFLRSHSFLLLIKRHLNRSFSTLVEASRACANAKDNPFTWLDLIASFSSRRQSASLEWSSSLRSIRVVL